MEPVILVSMNVAPVGGLTADVIKCIKALRKQGREVHVIYGFRGPGTLEAVNDPEVHWHHVFLIKRPPVISQIMLWIQAANRIQDIRRKHPNAFVACFDRLPIGNVVIGAAPISLWRKARRRLGMSTMFYQVAYQNWCKWMDHLIATSFKGKIIAYSKRDRDAWLDVGVKPENVVSLAIPTDTQRFHVSEKISKESSYILIIGRALKHKGIDLTLETWPTISARHPTLKLLVITQGWKVRRHIEQLGLQNIEVREFTTDIESLYHGSRLVIMPSLYETWGNVVPEALASGMPVVASSEVPSAELITDPDFGIVFERNGVDDKANLNTAIDQALALPMDLRTMEKRHQAVEQYMLKKNDIVKWLSAQGVTVE